MKGFSEIFKFDMSALIFLDRNVHQSNFCFEIVAQMYAMAQFGISVWWPCITILAWKNAISAVRKWCAIDCVSTPCLDLFTWAVNVKLWSTGICLCRGIASEGDEKWDHVIKHLAPVPQKDGKYVALGSNPDTWDNIDSRHDHPTMLAPLVKGGF